MTLDEIKQLQQCDCPKFANFAKDQLPMPGIKKHLNDILNMEILVIDYRLRESKRREGTKCLQLQFLLNGEVCVCFTGSSVLIDQVLSASEQKNFPFSGTIVKIDKYYSFS